MKYIKNLKTTTLLAITIVLISGSMSLNDKSKLSFIKTSYAYTDDFNYELRKVATESSSLNVRAEANSKSTVIGKLQKNSIVEVYGVEGDWVKVQIGDKFGWASKNYLKKVENTEIDASEFKDSLKVVSTESSSLNVRSKADSNSTVIGKLEKGAKVQIYGEQNGFYKVKVGNKFGWASSLYLAETELYDDIPVTDLEQSLARSGRVPTMAKSAYKGSPKIGINIGNRFNAQSFKNIANRFNSKISGVNIHINNNSKEFMLYETNLKSGSYQGMYRWKTNLSNTKFAGADIYLYKNKIKQHSELSNHKKNGGYKELVYSVLSHELGHALGLNDYPPEGYKTIMRYGCSSEFFKGPTKTDIEAIKVTTGLKKGSVPTTSYGNARVTSSSGTVVKQSASSSSKTLTTLKYGDRVKAISSSGNSQSYYKVEYTKNVGSNNKQETLTGYVNPAHLTKDGKSSSILKTENLLPEFKPNATLKQSTRLYESKSTTSKSYAGNKNERIMILSDAGGGWYKVRKNNYAQELYIKNEFVTKDGASSTTTSTTTSFSANASVINISSSLNVRATAKKKGTVISKLSKGTKVQVIGSAFTSDSIKWYKIKLSNGKTGYAAANYIKLNNTKRSIENDTTDFYTDIQSSLCTAFSEVDLTLRTSESIKSEVILTIPNNTHFIVLDIGEDWAKILLDDTIGYVPLENVIAYGDNGVLINYESKEEFIGDSESVINGIVESGTLINRVIGEDEGQTNTLEYLTTIRVTDSLKGNVAKGEVIQVLLPVDFLIEKGRTLNLSSGSEIALFLGGKEDDTNYYTVDLDNSILSFEETSKSRMAVVDVEETSESEEYGKKSLFSGLNKESFIKEVTSIVK